MTGCVGGGPSRGSFGHCSHRRNDAAEDLGCQPATRPALGEAHWPTGDGDRGLNQDQDGAFGRWAANHSTWLFSRLAKAICGLGFSRLDKVRISFFYYFVSRSETAIPFLDLVQRSWQVLPRRQAVLGRQGEIKPLHGVYSCRPTTLLSLLCLLRRLVILGIRTNSDVLPWI